MRILLTAGLLLGAAGCGGTSPTTADVPMPVGPLKSGAKADSRGPAMTAPPPPPPPTVPK